MPAHTSQLAAYDEYAEHQTAMRVCVGGRAAQLSASYLEAQCRLLWMAGRLVSMLQSRPGQLAEERWLTGSAQAGLLRGTRNSTPPTSCLADQLDGSHATPDHTTAVAAVGISDKAWPVAHILGTGLFVVVH